MSFRPSNVIEFEKGYRNLVNVEVIDQIMGSGKTHAALRYIEGLASSNTDSCWMYATERLDEINSRCAEAGFEWHTPSVIDGTKLDGLRILLQSPAVQLIALTHELLRVAMQSTDMAALINKRKAALLLDETIDLISAFDYPHEEFRRFYDKGDLTIDASNFGKVEWVDESIHNYDKRELVAEKILKGESSLHAVVQGKRVTLVEIKDARLLIAFTRIILTTYQFEGSLMAAWLHMKSIPWITCKCVEGDRSTSKAAVRSNITIVDTYDKQFAKMSLSSTWYKKVASQTDFNLINRTLKSIGDAYCAGDQSRLGYTVQKAALGSTRKGIQPRVYVHTVPYRNDLKEEIKGSVNKSLSGYIACNARASNSYASKNVMVHAYNRFVHASIAIFLDTYAIPYSKDLFALNEMMQWIWRSAIRNKQPIHLIVLSSRMKKLFLSWLECEDNKPFANAFNETVFCKKQVA